MNKLLLLTCAVCLAGAAPPTPPVKNLSWTPQQVAQLRRWIEHAPQDALLRLSTSEIDRAAAVQDMPTLNAIATSKALQLGRMHLQGSASLRERTGWRIPDDDGSYDLPARLGSALAANKLDTFFEALRPSHPEYLALRAAYRVEGDSRRRATLARNMERWRWMPLALGDRYLIVNVPRFEVSLWQQSVRIDSWSVIVGKQSTPTPVFAADVTGVNFNPWWTVPKSIVEARVGALIRRSPAEARRRGYQWGGGQYRQRPGPDNALGQVKLVMPNPFSVYLHDTPNKELFDKDVRAFSFGCVRVQDATDLAATLLAGVKTRAETEAVIASGRTVTFGLAKPVRVYVTYFTASANPDGAVVFHSDIYDRDSRVGEFANLARACGA